MVSSGQETSVVSQSVEELHILALFILACGSRLS